MKRLWEKGEALDARVHRFTVGDDPKHDQKLLYWDVLGSIAHARMLNSIEILAEQECSIIIDCLSELAKQACQTKVQIPYELEDCHTFIEDYLIKRIGNVGEKIHTGRSRNDQVITAMRLYLRHACLSLLQLLIDLSDSYFVRAVQEKDIPMPGYTHFQPAMPSSVPMWLQAFGEAGLELISEGFALLETINTNPLGSGAGFGVPLKLDREMTTKLLGFSKTQRNSINIQNSRGKFEQKLTRWGVDIVSVIEKFAIDMITYSSREFGFFTLDFAFTTGSSIMPQKHNPDVLELLRARAGKLRAADNELSWTISKLASNYHRDFQCTKEAVFRVVDSLEEVIPICTMVVNSFKVNKAKLEDAMYPELYATYEVYREVKKGMAFREAYKQVALLGNYKQSKEELSKEEEIIKMGLRQELNEAQFELASFKKKFKEVYLKYAKIHQELCMSV